jgi:ribosome-associated translation inhibitor RaiA
MFTTDCTDREGAEMIRNTVEINGKTYTRQEVEEALKKLNQPINQLKHGQIVCRNSKFQPDAKVALRVGEVRSILRYLDDDEFIFTTIDGTGRLSWNGRNGSDTDNYTVLNSTVYG